MHIISSISRINLKINSMYNKMQNIVSMEAQPIFILWKENEIYNKNKNNAMKQETARGGRIWQDIGWFLCMCTTFPFKWDATKTGIAYITVIRKRIKLFSLWYRAW